jgi:hypothetical protein
LARGGEVTIAATPMIGYNVQVQTGAAKD